MTVPESNVVTPARSDRLLRRVLRRPLGAISLTYLVLLIAAVIFAPLITSQGPLSEDLLHVFSGPTSAHLLGTLREALSNIARHAHASSATIELTASSAWFRLRVVDDGVGFDPASVTHGHGTRNLRARAEELGGHLEVTSAPGQGTTLVWVIPAVG